MSEFAKAVRVMLTLIITLQTTGLSPCCCRVLRSTCHEASISGQQSCCEPAHAISVARSSLTKSCCCGEHGALRPSDRQLPERGPRLPDLSFHAMPTALDAPCLVLPAHCTQLASATPWSCSATDHRSLLQVYRF
ncbi:MAG: hypothetical protein U1E76_12200 [Planctomycetota bacterium]